MMKGRSAAALTRVAQRLPPHARSQKMHAVSVPPETGSYLQPQYKAHPEMAPSRRFPLSILPLTTLLRSFVMTSLSSYPLVLRPSLRLLSYMTHSSSPLLNPDRNSLLRFLLKRTFYAQYCAGETRQEVEKTVRGLKELGFRGVMLTYGKESVFSKSEKLGIAKRSVADPVLKENERTTFAQEIEAWRAGTMKTLEMTQDGDFVALKFSGAGKEAMRQLAMEEPPSLEIERATTEICDLAKRRGASLLFDAEQKALQGGIDAWTMKFQKSCNQRQAVVYGTYQAYLRSCPSTLSQHLQVAQKENFVLGVKLVRGAYMASDPRDVFWETKQETNRAFDRMTEALLRREWNAMLQPGDPAARFPDVDLVIASHNKDSVAKALGIQEQQKAAGECTIDVAYGQLMGMADEVSCDLVLADKTKAGSSRQEKAGDIGPNAYKYLVWGSVRECLGYLVRRGEENRDAVFRARDTRIALRKELMRRIGLSKG